MLTETDLDKLSEVGYGSPVSVYLADGPILRATLKPDEFTDINDFDHYGNVRWVRNNYEGHSVRPSEFDGRAEIIDKNWNEALWWQPPVDVDRNSEWFDRLRILVCEIVHFGYWGIVLELCDGQDAYGNPIVKHFASIWGIEPSSTPEDVRYYISDLWSEIEGEINEQ